MMIRRSHIIDPDLMRRLRIYALTHGRNMQDAHMDAVREYLDRRAAESAQADDVIRTDAERSAA